MNIFVTFSSTGYEWARERICKEALDTCFFDKVLSYNEKQLSPELLSSETFKIKKGLGHYSWKPDIIWLAMQQCKEDDILCYCDAGCTLTTSKEWEKYRCVLASFSILTFNIFQRNYRWIRRSIFRHFSSEMSKNIKDSFQIGANCLFVKNDAFGRHFVSEWRDYMINRLDLCGDVPEDELSFEDVRFIENRYDQSILTALSYKYQEKGIAQIKWEHYEGFDPFMRQAVRASRLRKKGDRDYCKLPKKIIWGIFRFYILYPFFKMSKR